MKKEVVKKSANDNNFGLVSVTLGILSIVLSLNSPVGGIILGIVSLVFANKQQSRNPNSWGRNGKTLAVIGIILGIIVLVIALWAINNLDLPAIA